MGLPFQDSGGGLSDERNEGVFTILNIFYKNRLNVNEMIVLESLKKYFY